jgi:hypothetical protein
MRLQVSCKLGFLERCETGLLVELVAPPLKGKFLSDYIRQIINICLVGEVAEYGVVNPLWEGLLLRINLAFLANSHSDKYPLCYAQESFMTATHRRSRIQNLLPTEFQMLPAKCGPRFGTVWHDQSKAKVPSIEIRPV